MATHTLTQISAIDVPDDVASEIMRLLAGCDPDIYVTEFERSSGPGVERGRG